MGYSDAAFHGSRHHAGCTLSKLFRPEDRECTGLAAYLATNMASLTHEQFRAFYLNGEAAQPLDEQIWTGSHTEVSVPFRQIVGRAIALDATALVIAHNHPSGDPSPSREDVEVTRRLFNICRQLDIRIQDHVIVGRQRTFSFVGQGLL